MRALDVNLLPTRAARSSARRESVLIVMTLASILTAGIQCAVAWTRLTEAAQLRSVVALPARPGVLATPGQPLTQRSDVENARRLAAAAAFDVGQALGHLEAIREPGAHLRLLEINAVEGTLHVHFELQDAAAMRVIVDNVVASSNGLQWALQEFEAPRSGQPGLVRLRGQRSGR